MFQDRIRHGIATIGYNRTILTILMFVVLSWEQQTSYGCQFLLIYQNGACKVALKAEHHEVYTPSLVYREIWVVEFDIVFYIMYVISNQLPTYSMSFEILLLPNFTTNHGKRLSITSTCFEYTIISNWCFISTYKLDQKPYISPKCQRITPKKRIREHKSVRIK